jgi:RNA-directed DNA polymerase
MARENSTRRTREDEITDTEHRDGPSRSSDEGRQRVLGEGDGLSSPIRGSTMIDGRNPLKKARPFEISQKVVVEAWKQVKANQGAAGVDRETIADFEKDLKNNLYKIWNRMSSGSYMPPPVRAVSIPKKTGGERVLGVPSISDRVAQTVWKQHFEPIVEPHFHEDSYGYRPGKSALDAVEITQKRCWRYDWVLEFDIKGLFDNIDFELLMKTVRWHTKETWLLLYVERWLKAPFQKDDGTLVERTKGTPQGGVVSPILANLFLHYVFDLWMKRTYPLLPFCRYADDGVVHCRTESEARVLRKALEKRFNECKLELHPEKTRIVYCKTSRREKDYPVICFDFLGYTFRPRFAKTRQGECFVGFLPGVSNTAGKDMRQRSRRGKLHLRSDLSLEDQPDREGLD